ncbi:MAG TPA: hypothetical protein V6C76_12450 [Drouetiella sp.]
MTSLRSQNLVNAVCGFLSGFFFMSFAMLRGYFADLSFVIALSCVSLSFAFQLIRLLRKNAADKKFNFCVGAFLPISSMFFYCLLMIASSMNPSPKPFLIIASCSLSLGVILTSLTASLAPAVGNSFPNRLQRH